MLPPKYLSTAADRVVELYGELEESVLQDIARRIQGTDFQMTSTAKWQAHKAQQAGAVYGDIIARVSAVTGKSKKEVKELFQESAVISLEADNKTYELAGLEPVRITQSKFMQDALNAGLKKTNNELRNLTRTVAKSTQTAFVSALDLAHMQVISGVFDYNTAIYNATKKALREGAFVQYPSKGGKPPHRDRIDVAVRRAVTTGVNQTCAKVNEARNNEMGQYIYETTAHAGARPEHAKWQGGWYDIRGSGHSKYPGLKEATGWGNVDGLEGAGCRHSKNIVIPGFSKPTYTQKEIDRINNETVNYNGQTVKRYDAEQMCRAHERKIRDYKRELAAMGELKGNPEAEARFANLSVKLKKREAAYRDFLNQTKIKEDRSRVRVVGFGEKRVGKSGAGQ